MGFDTHDLLTSNYRTQSVRMEHEPSAGGPEGARRHRCAYGARQSFPTQARGIAASTPFKRSKIAQALLDVLALASVLLLISTTAVSIAASFFILLFVRT